MKKYVALLKQVYFRKKFIHMSELKEFFESIGMKNVRTVFNSGNVIFDSNESKECLHNFISKMLNDHYMYDIDTFLVTMEEVKSIVNSNPYELRKNYYNQVFICRNNFEKDLYNEFSKLDLIKDEKFKLNNGLLYWTYYKPAEHDSNILKILSRESLKHNFTLRTIGTIKKILMC